MVRLRTPLYGYQKRGVEKIQAFGGRALVADEPGLGKTIQSIAWMDKYLPKGKGIVIIICPAHLKWNWQREVRTHLGLESYILEGRTPPWVDAAGNPKDIDLPDGIYIINYDIIGTSVVSNTWLRLLLLQNIRLVIADEVQAIQNIEAKRTQGVKKLCEYPDYLIFLSGTPFTNYPIGLYPMLRILKPSIFPSRKRFAMEYCDPQRKPWGWEFKGATNGGELRQILLDNVMIRRTKRQVLKDLPEKIRSVIPVEIDNRKEYTELEKNFLAWMAKHRPDTLTAAERCEKLVQLGYMKRVAAQGKMKATLDWTARLMEQCGTEKFINFAIHTKIINQIQERFKGQCVVVTGKTPPRQREVLKEKFWHNPNIRMYIGNIKAAGTGWNGQCATHVIFSEIGWVPADLIQCEDRSNRIGQKFATNCWYMTALGTIEEKLCRIVQAKQESSNEIIDGIAGSGDYNIYDQVSEMLKKERDDNKAKTSKKKRRGSVRPVD